jgi:hypothetical protein
LSPTMAANKSSSLFMLNRRGEERQRYTM